MSEGGDGASSEVEAVEVEVGIVGSNGDDTKKIDASSFFCGNNSNTSCCPSCCPSCQNYIT
jgi:hypothetical protein